MLSCLTANCYWFVNTFKKTYDPNFFRILVLPILYVIDLFYQQKQKPKYRMSNMDKVDLKKSYIAKPNFQNKQEKMSLLQKK